MTRKQANKELIKYKEIKGMTSSYFYTMIQDLFVGPKNHIKVRVEYGVSNGTLIFSNNNIDDFIVWAKFDNLFIPANLVQVE